MLHSKRVRSCEVCADSYCETHNDVEGTEAGLDSVDAPPRFLELKGDEVNKYEIDEDEEYADESKSIEKRTDDDNKSEGGK